MQETKEIYGIIYMIRNKINNKIYIGQTTEKGGFKRRYRNDLYKNTHNKHLKNSIQKYGIENFEIDEEFDIAYSKEELGKLEYMYIKVYNTMNKEFGYNEREGGIHGKWSEEAKQRARHPRPHLQGENNPKYGKPLSEETKKKLSEANKGKMSGENNPWYGKTGEQHPAYGLKHTEETKQYLRDINLGENNPMYGKHWTEEQKKVRSDNIKGENNPFYGKHHSEESKKKISKSRQGKYKGKNSPRAKAIYCYELDEIRLCAKDWCEELGISAGNISEVCKGNRKQTHGYHFRYATEEEIEEYKIKHEYKGSDL